MKLARTPKTLESAILPAEDGGVSPSVSAETGWCGRFAAAVLAVMLLGRPLPCAAQAEPLDEVVVTATRIPIPRRALAASVDKVLIDDSLNALQGLDFAEALEAVPGLYVQGRFNAAQDLRIDLRGFGARGNFGIRGIRIYVDGVPESLPDGQAQVDSLDPADLESVEILKGPSGALYGGGAGGVILLDTVAPEAAPRWRVQGGMGEHGFSRLAATVAVKGRGALTGLRLKMSRQNLDGYRTHARSEQRRLAAEMRFSPGPGDIIDVRARVTDSPEAQDPGGLTLDQFRRQPRSAAANNLAFDAAEALDQQNLSFRWQRSRQDGRALEVMTYGTWRDFGNRLPFETGGVVRIRRTLGGARAQLRLPGPGAGRWFMGVEVDHQDDHRRRFDNLRGRPGALRLDQQEEVTAAGIYAGADWPLLEKAGMRAGLRADTVRIQLEDFRTADGDDSGSRRFTRLSPELGLHMALAEALQGWVRFGTSFETPTTTELANPSGAGFNPSLDAQESRSGEIGIRWLRAGPVQTLEAVVYQVNATDELVAFELEGQPGRSFFANAAESRRRGLEVAMTAARDPLSLRLSGSWSDAEFRRFIQDGNDWSGRLIPGTPGLRLAGSLNWRPAADLVLTLEAERVARVYADNANSVRSPDFLDVGFRVSRGLLLGRSRLQLHAGARNLLDQEFADNLRSNAFGGRYFEPAPARYFYAGFSIGAAED